MNFLEAMAEVQAGKLVRNSMFRRDHVYGYSAHKDAVGVLRRDEFGQLVRAHFWSLNKADLEATDWEVAGNA